MLSYANKKGGHSRVQCDKGTSLIHLFIFIYSEAGKLTVGIWVLQRQKERRTW